MASPVSVLQSTLTVILLLTGITILVTVFHKSPPPVGCIPPHSYSGPQKKPIMLLWFWPENKMFDFKICETYFKIDHCRLTDDRSLYPRAHGVLIFHKAIKDDLSNLPNSPRNRFQRWIWFSMDPPNKTHRIESIQSLFNLTLSYRKDSDIQVRWRLTVKNNTDEDFVLPKKERFLCWIMNSDDQSGEGYNYYRELEKHITVDVFSSAELSKADNYFLTISSCKFYLSFEKSIHRDYISETFNGPLAAGTVPIVLGPPRKNYEDFAPGSSFIHVNDFPDAKALATFLLKLDIDHEAYMRFFNWRRFYYARRHLTEEKHEFAHAICQACRHLGLSKVYRAIPDLNKWLLQ